MPVLAEILARFSELDGRLRRLLDNAIKIQRHRLDRSISGLGEMHFRVHAQAQHLDDLHDRMTGSVTERLTALQRDLVEHRHALLSKGPHHRIPSRTCLAPATVKRLEQGRRVEDLFREAIDGGAHYPRLRPWSPLAILGRGFSILRTVPEGTMVRRASDVMVGQTVQARLAEGNWCVWCARCWESQCLDPTTCAGNNARSGDWSKGGCGCSKI